MSDALAQVPFQFVAGAAEVLPPAGPASAPASVDIEALPTGRFRVRFSPVRHGGDDDAWWRWSPDSAERLGPGIALPHEVRYALVGKASGERPQLRGTRVAAKTRAARG